MRLQRKRWREKRRCGRLGLSKGESIYGVDYLHGRRLERTRRWSGEKEGRWAGEGFKYEGRLPSQHVLMTITASGNKRGGRKGLSFTNSPVLPLSSLLCHRTTLLGPPS